MDYRPQQDMHGRLYCERCNRYVWPDIEGFDYELELCGECAADVQDSDIIGALTAELKDARDKLANGDLPDLADLDRAIARGSRLA